MSPLRWIALLTVSATASIAASPQQRAPAPPDVIRINVNLVQVDAVVTDNKGKAVTDLTAEDFEVFQDGKPQVITNFSFIDVKDRRVRGGSNTAPRTPAQRGRGGPGLPPPPVTLRPPQIRRTVALVVDDLGLSFD